MPCRGQVICCSSRHGMNAESEVAEVFCIRAVASVSTEYAMDSVDSRFSGPERIC